MVGKTPEEQLPWGRSGGQGKWHARTCLSNGWVGFQQAQKGIENAEGAVKKALVLSKEWWEGWFGKNRDFVRDVDGKEAGTRSGRAVEARWRLMELILLSVGSYRQLFRRGDDFLVSSISNTVCLIKNLVKCLGVLGKQAGLTSRGL